MYVDPFSLERPTFRVSRLSPAPWGRPRVTDSWVTDGEGVIRALEDPENASAALQVEMIDWSETLQPWIFQRWDGDAPNAAV